MSCYPSDASAINYITYPVGPTPSGATVTAAGSTNTKGSYTELVSATGFDSTMIEITVQVMTASATAPLYLLDIATGGAGSETVVIPNLLVEKESASASSGVNGARYVLPLAVANGTRVAARCQSTTAGAVMQVVITLWTAGGCPGITSFTNAGANTSTSGGVQIDPGGSANTKGAYAQLTASTTSVAQWVLIMYTLGGNSAPSTARWYIDFATGAAASETVLIPDSPLSLGFGSGVWFASPRSRGFVTYVPASTRLAMRASCNITDATDRLIQAAVLYAPAPSEPSGSGGGAWAFA